MADELQRTDAATRAVDLIRRERVEVAKQIRTRKEAKARSEKSLARVDKILRELERI